MEIIDSPSEHHWLLLSATFLSHSIHPWSGLWDDPANHCPARLEALNMPAINLIHFSRSAASTYSMPRLCWIVPLVVWHVLCLISISFVFNSRVYVFCWDNVCDLFFFFNISIKFTQPFPSVIICRFSCLRRPSKSLIFAVYDHKIFQGLVLLLCGIGHFWSLTFKISCSSLVECHPKNQGLS